MKENGKGVGGGVFEVTLPGTATTVYGAHSSSFWKPPQNRNGATQDAPFSLHPTTAVWNAEKRKTKNDQKDRTSKV